MSAVLEARFFSNVRQAGSDPVESCWPWTAGKYKSGYGSWRQGIAHRWVWEFFNGPIPDGLTIDHLCHTSDKSCPGGNTCPHRACVNPAHLEPVTRAVNASRAGGWTDDACGEGHPRSEFEVWASEKVRYCRECKRIKQRARRRAAGVRFVTGKAFRHGDL